MLRRALIPALIAAAAALTSLYAQTSPAPRITQAISDRQLIRLPGNTPARIRAAVDRGAVAPELPLSHMLLVLRHSPAQQAALAQLLDEQRENDSPQFHQWLTPEQFGARFGPAPADVAAVTAWLAGEGFQIDQVAAGGGTIEFSGPAASVAAAFHTQMRHYQVQGVMHLANATDPSIPAALAPLVAGVASLNDFQSQPASHIVAHATAAVPPPGQARPSLNYTDQNGAVQHALVPGDLGKVYDLGANPPTGTGETIALVARSDIEVSDLNNFHQHFLPGASGMFQTVYVSGDPGVAANGDQDEATLDAEWANALAPGANVDLVVAASTDTTDGVDLSAQYIVDHDLAPVMSASFGQCEALQGAAENTFWANLWQQAATEGITVLVSSGDNGAAGCDDPTKIATQGLAVSGMASTPYDTAVGGTEFNEAAVPGTYWSASATSFTTALGYIPEEVWNESSNASGKPALWSGSGGVSSIYAKPAWQAGSGVPADQHRDLPDVALTAAAHDGYVVCESGSCASFTGSFSFRVVSGTSAAAPAWAGIMALVDQQQGGPVGLVNPVLYQLASAAPSVLHDVTAGNNDVPCQLGTPNCNSGSFGYSAGAGYDLATGLGTPDIANLLQKWGSVKFAASTTTLQITLPQSLTYGQSVPAAIAVAPAGSGPTPTGTVLIVRRDSSGKESPLDTLTLDSSGRASVAALLLPAGTYQVVAQFSGDLNYGRSVSQAVAVQVSPLATTVAVQLAAVDPRGQPVPMALVSYGDTITASVTVSAPGAPATVTGTVQLYATSFGATPFSGAATAISGAGLATFTDQASQSPGSFSFAVRYSGDNNFAPATSATVTLTIAQTATTLQITSVTAEGVHVAVHAANGYLSQNPFGFNVQVTTGGTPVSSGNTYTTTTDTQGQPEWDVLAVFDAPVPGTSATYVAQTAGNADYLASASAPLVAATPPNLSFSPSSLTFPTVTVGSSSVLTTALRNTGGLAATLHLSIINAAFTETDDCGGTLASGASCQVQVTFTPYTGATAYSGQLASSQPGDLPVSLTGSSQGFGLGLSSTSTFDSKISAGQPATFQLQFTPANGLTGHLTLACSGLPDFTSCGFAPASPVMDGSSIVTDTLTVTYSPADAATPPPSASGPAAPLGLILLVGAGLLFVLFAPVARPLRPGIVLGALLVLTACGGGGGGGGSPPPNDGGGTAPPVGAASVQLTPGAIGFGNVQVGQTSAAQPVSVLNSGTAALSIARVSLVSASGSANDFLLTNACGGTLAAGANCQLQLQFRPSSLATETAAMQIADSAADSPQSVTLTGAGVHTELLAGSYWFTVTAQGAGQSQQIQLELTVP